jgi:oligopeptide transport system substrate-binding protein
MQLTKRLFFAYLALIVASVLAYGVSRRLAPPRDPETLFTTYIAGIRSLDPAQIYDVVSGDIAGHVFETLYNYKYGGRPDELFPQLAADMPEVSADGLTYTIRLRKGVRFIDPRREFWPGGVGPEVTARDVLISWKRFANFHAAAGAYSSFFQGNIVGLDEFREYTQSVQPDEVDFGRPVAGLEAVDSHTVRVRLTKPVPQFVLFLAALPTAVVSAEAAEKKPDLSDRPVGTGPYMFAEYLPEFRIVLERNPVYRGRPDVDGEGGAKLEAGERLPKIGRIQYDYSLETLPAWHLFLQGRYDVMGIPKETFASAITPDRKLRPELAGRDIDLRVRDDLGLYFIQFNMTDPVIGKLPELRQAMSLAFDRETYIRVYRNGRGTAGTGILPPDAPLWDGKYVSKWHRHDPAAAKAKLAEAVHKLGRPMPKLKIMMGDTDTETRQQGEFFKAQMAAIGLDVETEYSTYDRYLARMDAKDYQITWAGWYPDYPDEKTYLKLYDARLATPPGSNTTGFNSSMFQEHMLAAEKLTRSPERDRHYLAMRDIVDEEVPSFTIFYPKVYSLRYNWVGNLQTSYFTAGFQSYWTLDTARRRESLRSH